MLPDDGSGAEADPPPPGSAAPGGVRRRVSWTIADQAVASSTSIGTSVVAARSLDREGFGAFGLAFTVYLLVMGACRALVTEPLLTRYSRMEEGQPAARAREVVGAAAGIGLASALALLVAAAVVGNAAGQALCTLAVVLPGLLVQDAWRYWFVTTGRPKSAVYNDGIWSGAQLVLLIPLAWAHLFNLVTIIAWWGLSGVLAGLAGCIAAHTMPSASSTLRWIGAHRDLGGRYVAEFASASGAGYGALMALGAIAGLGALGALRATQVYFGPINVLFGGIYLALVPEGARLSGDRRKLDRLMKLASVGLVVVAALWLAVGLFVPTGMGRAVFGVTWDGARKLLWPTGLGVLGGGVAAGGMAGLRALGAARASLRARLAGLPLMIGAPLAGASLADARGFALGLAGATWAGAAIWWWQFERALRDQADPRSQFSDIQRSG